MRLKPDEIYSIKYENFKQSYNMIIDKLQREGGEAYVLG